MTARDKTRPFTTKSDKGMRDEVKPDHGQELAAASERFARVLRTAPVETTQTGQRDIRHVLFSGDEAPALDDHARVAVASIPLQTRRSIDHALALQRVHSNLALRCVGVTPSVTSLG